MGIVDEHTVRLRDEITGNWNHSVLIFNTKERNISILQL